MSSANPTIIERKERWARKMSGKTKPASRSSNRLLPGQHLTSGFPVLDLGIRPDISLEEWRLEVSGLVEHPAMLTWEEFGALPRFEDEAISTALRPGASSIAIGAASHSSPWPRS